MSASPIRILVAEDDDNVAAIVEMLLEGSGRFQVTRVEDGFQAMRQIDKNKFDLLLLDMMMPQIDGLELLRRLRQEENYTGPILMFTAQNKQSSIDQAKALGATDVLLKPFDPETLVDQILGYLHGLLGEKA